MPKLIVCNKELGHTLFEISEGTHTIGRGNEADLLLPNVSVSREHARVTMIDGVVRIEDLESRNGTLINGQKASTHDLVSGDEIQLGKYLLVFLGDGRAHQFYRGRYVGYMRAYEARAVYTEDSTFAMSPDHLMRLQREQSFIRNSKVVSANNPAKFWFPEDRSLTFGGDGMVPIDGWLNTGIVAEVTWNGQHHVIHKHARMAKVLVNERSISEQPLRNGDRIRIGSMRFRFEAPVSETI